MGVLVFREEQSCEPVSKKERQSEDLFQYKILEVEARRQET